MKGLSSILAVFVIYLNTGMAYSADFPAAPARLKEAAAQGLTRVSTEELRGLLNGPLEYKGEKTQHVLDYRPDGTVVRKNETKQIGKWDIDESKNAYCTAFTFKKGYQRNCFAVFRAADGIHFFDYDADKGYDVHVWRRATQ